MSMKVIASVFLCGVLGVLDIGANCPFTCVCERTFSICREPRIFTDPPTQLPPPKIDLSTAEVLPGGVLPVNITEISFENNPIKSITDDAFDDSAYTLTSFSLSTSPLTRIPDALLHLHALNYLSIDNTNIVDWNPNVLTSIGRSVTVLFLTNVGLNVWPSWMSSFTNVSTLSFGGSAMTSIPDDAFKMMNHLTSLTLDGNKLSVVPKALSGITTLQSLDISNCFISDITWLPNSSLLTSLSLGGNKLSNATHVRNTLLPFVKSLSEIDFHDNQLTSIPDLHFLAVGYSLNMAGNLMSNSKIVSFPSKLNEIDLSSNLFSLIPGFMSALQFVSTLSMSSNHVTTIRATDFSPNILYIQLDRNLVTELTDTSFPENSTIISLVLDYNPLTIISNSAFNGLINLSYMSLQNSHLTRLPLALASLKNLNTFDISGSLYLVCTCMEKSMGHWVLSRMSEYSVNGNCGQTNIYDFFKFLSPGCPVA